MKVLSITFKTESGDDYHVLEEVGSEQEFIEIIKKMMGDELQHVWSWSICSIDANEKLADELFRQALNSSNGEEIY